MSNEKVRSYYNKKNRNVKRTREMTWNDAILPPFCLYRTAERWYNRLGSSQNKTMKRK